jgi:hypothetical protein
MKQFNEKIFKEVKRDRITTSNIFKSTSGSDLTKKLAEAIFNADITVYPKYKLIDAGGTILIETSAGEFKSLGLHHMSEEGVLCDDLETFIKWEDFSK